MGGEVRKRERKRVIVVAGRNWVGVGCAVGFRTDMSYCLSCVFIHLIHLAAAAAATSLVCTAKKSAQ